MVKEIESKAHGVLVSGFIETDMEPHATITITEYGYDSTGNSPDDLREIADMLYTFADTLENEN